MPTAGPALRLPLAVLQSHMLRLLLVVSDDNEPFAAWITANTSAVIKTSMLSSFRPGYQTPVLPCGDAEVEAAQLVCQQQHCAAVTAGVLAHVWGCLPGDGRQVWEQCYLAVSPPDPAVGSDGSRLMGQLILWCVQLHGYYRLVSRCLWTGCCVDPFICCADTVGTSAH